MAKLKAPLLSLGASGAIGKALVFFGWKGLDVVREYVVPANPQTSSQTTQRGYVTAAVAAIHTAQGAGTPLDEDDKTAYAALASTRSTPRTWFNEIVKLWTDVKVAAKVPIIYRNGTVMDPIATTIDIEISITEETGSQLAAGKFYFGTSKTSLINSTVATVNAGVNVTILNVDLSAFLTAGFKYYFQFRPDAADPCEGAISGIYNFVAA